MIIFGTPFWGVGHPFGVLDNLCFECKYPVSKLNPRWTSNFLSVGLCQYELELGEKCWVMAYLSIAGLGPLQYNYTCW